MLARFARKHEGDSSVLAETLAVEAAIKLAIHCGWRKVCFMSVSNNAIDAINNASSNLSLKNICSNLDPNLEN